MLLISLLGFAVEDKYVIIFDLKAYRSHPVMPLFVNWKFCIEYSYVNQSYVFTAYLPLK